jgi:transposase
MTSEDELRRLRAETRKLRQEYASKKRTEDALQKRNQALNEKVVTLKEEIGSLEKEKEQLIKENDDLKLKLGITQGTAKKYAGMLFKSSVRRAPSDKKSGAQVGHVGHRRKQPDRIDREVRVFLSHCPDCHKELNRTDSHDTRIVEDIPVPQTVVTRYEIERQWCTCCNKEVVGTPKDTVPGFSIGLNALTHILFLKYRLRTTLRRIVEELRVTHRLTFTEGGIQSILHAFRTQFTTEYGAILKEIRDAPVKHADETSWRIDGENGYAWLFSTPTAAYYTIEETRGKGVPEETLGPAPNGLLVHDDYGGYQALPMDHQSCWTHLLRVSHDHAEKETAATEMIALHTELSELFAALDEANKRPFIMQERLKVHAVFLRKVRSIIARTYTSPDALAVHTRISNQDKNLVEALLHEGAPLTNNHAERMIRPLVVTRRISGGSRSDDGAATHAVNMTIMQTLSLKGIDYIEGVRAIIHAGNPRYATGNG